jgi:hypothetical protein
VFLGKFWGLSAWMLELIMVLSAVLGRYSDLAVVGALLVINAVLSFMQEHRAAGVVSALRRRLQVSARVRRESNWQVIPARDLVLGDILRVRPGDLVPADAKLLTGALTVDQSALTEGGVGVPAGWVRAGLTCHAPTLPRPANPSPPLPPGARRMTARSCSAAPGVPPASASACAQSPPTARPAPPHSANTG